MNTPNSAVFLNDPVSPFSALHAAKAGALQTEKRIHLIGCVFICTALMMHEDVIDLFYPACRLRAEAAHGSRNGKHPYRCADRHMLIVCQAHGDRLDRHLPFVHSIPAAPPEAEGALRPLGRLNLIGLGAAAVCLLIRELPDIAHAREEHNQTLFVCADVQVIRRIDAECFLLAEHPRGIACGGQRRAVSNLDFCFIRPSPIYCYIGSCGLESRCFEPNVDAPFGVPRLHGNGVRAGFRDIDFKARSFLAVSGVNDRAIRRRDLHVQRAFCRFKFNLQHISGVQAQGVAVGSVHAPNVHAVGIRIFYPLAGEAGAAVNDKEYRQSCQQRQKHNAGQNFNCPFRSHSFYRYVQPFLTA